MWRSWSRPGTEPSQLKTSAEGRGVVVLALSAFVATLVLFQPLWGPGAVSSPLPPRDVCRSASCTFRPLGAGEAVAGRTSCTPCAGAYTVQPIFFVPDPASFPVGYQPTEAELAEDLANIDEAMGRVAQWFGPALGRTDSLDVFPAIRLDAFGGLSAYEITWVDPEARYEDGIVLGDTWGTVLGEVTSRGYDPGTTNCPQTIVIFCKGAGGFAGGAQWFASTGGGMCMLGDFCLDSLAERVPPEHATWWTGIDRQTGAIAHEAGHTWGLAHPDEINPTSGVQDYPYTLMGAWWDWPTFPLNPADPSWPWFGLHGWAQDSGPSGLESGYQDSFFDAHRAGWLGDLPAPTLPQFAGNGHFYEVIDAAVTWDEALALAATCCHQGTPGYLATVTSASENQFLTDTFGAAALHSHWIGAKQASGAAEPDGGWEWHTGEPFDYANWEPGEPNNSIPNENAILFDHGVGTDGKRWNDGRDFVPAGGFVVEYPATAADVPPPLSASGGLEARILGAHPVTHGQPIVFSVDIAGSRAQTQTGLHPVADSTYRSDDALMVALFDARGRQVVAPVQGHPGDTTIEIAAERLHGLPSGKYYARVSRGDAQAVTQVTLLR